MAALSRRRRGLDFWPGFVDALAALLMVMIFVILIFWFAGRQDSIDREFGVAEED